jgi:lipoyl(octanoyl) transferase
LNSLSSDKLIVRRLGLQSYEKIWQEMSQFTDTRGEDTDDELWVLEHEPVFTQGQAGKAEHILNPGDIPIIQSDRGGQVTYHGPGQLVVYPLIDLRRKKLSVRDMVSLLENTVVQLLESYDLSAYPKADAPGVYVQSNEQEMKIASLGLRVRKGCCFHGLSINVDMDLSPFDRINPCGYSGLKMTQLAALPHKQDLQYSNIESLVIDLITENLAARQVKAEA